jgi:hypothetical protein
MQVLISWGVWVQLVCCGCNWKGHRKVVLFCLDNQPRALVLLWTRWKRIYTGKYFIHLLYVLGLPPFFLSCSGVELFWSFIWPTIYLRPFFDVFQDYVARLCAIVWFLVLISVIIMHSHLCNFRKKNPVSLTVELKFTLPSDNRKLYWYTLFWNRKNLDKSIRG